MSKKLLRVILASFIGCVVSTICPTTSTGDDREAETNPGDSLELSLGRTVSVTAVERPLIDIAKQLGKDAGVEIRFDLREIAAYDIDPATDVVTAEVHRVELRHALTWVLNQLGLVWRQRGTAIEITTREAVQNDTTVAVLDVADLLRLDDSHDDQEDFECLKEMLTANIAPDTWVDVGGFGHVKQFRGKLLIHNTPANIARVRGFLAELRGARALALAHTETAPPRSSFPVDRPALASVDEALRRPIGINIEKGSTYEVLKRIQDKHQLPMIFDLAAIGEADFDLNAEVNRVPGAAATLEEALNQICGGTDLEWTIARGALMLTVADNQSLDGTYLETRLYPVLDLLGDEVPADEFDDRRRDFDYGDLLELITAGIDETSWDEQGGPAVAEAEPNYGLLVIFQSRSNHQAVDRLLHSLRQEMARHPRVKREPIERVGSPMRLVIYRFATPASEQQRRWLAIKRAEAEARAKRAASGSVAGPSSSGLDTMPDLLPDEPRLDPLRDDPFAPPLPRTEPEKKPAELDDDNPFLDGDAAANNGPPRGLGGSLAPLPGQADGNPDPFGDQPDPFDDQPDPFGAPSERPSSHPFLFEVPVADMHAYEPDPSGELPIAEDELLQAITGIIDPASWVRDERTVAKTAHGRVIIRHTDAVHRKIRKLAERLRIKDFREIDQWPAFGGLGGGFF